MKMNPRCHGMIFFILQGLTEDIKVEELSYEWTKYLSSLFEPANSACEKLA